jgi:hypothetical protein
MQCIKNIPRHLLLKRFYEEKEKLAKALCEQKQNLETERFFSSGNLKRARNLGVNCFKEKASMGSGYLITNYSNRLRKLNAIKQGTGKTLFASSLLNDYGKREGAPGGYGSSPKNRF